MCKNLYTQQIHLNAVCKAKSYETKHCTISFVTLLTTVYSQQSQQRTMKSWILYRKVKLSTSGNWILEYFDGDKKKLFWSVFVKRPFWFQNQIVIQSNWVSSNLCDV